MALEPDGFRYARSGPHATKRCGPWKYVVSFQSGRIGHYFSIHYAVLNDEYRDWQIKLGPMPGPPGMITGMNIGFLTPTRNWLDVDVAEPAKRQAAMDQALATIREWVLPFFDLFTNSVALARSLAFEPHPGFFYEHKAVEYVAWQLGTEAAEQCLAYQLAKLTVGNPEAMEIFRTSFGDPDTWNAHYASMLGLTARRIGLDARFHSTLKVVN